MNLDEQLKQIKRPERSISEKEETKQLIQMKLEKSEKNANWSYRGILVSVCALVFFLIATINTSPATNHEQTGTPFGHIDENTTIEKATVLENDNPQNNLNLNSIFYPSKKSVKENHYFDDIVPILLSAKENAIPWSGTIHNDLSVKDFHFHFSNNEEVYLKLDSEETSVLIDPYAKMKYKLTKEEGRLLSSFFYDSTLNNPLFTPSKKITFAIMIVLFIGASTIIDRLEKKRFRVENSDKEIKSSWFLRGSINSIAILGLNIVMNKIGTFHLGIAGLFLLTVIIIENLIRVLINKQPIYWKYEIIQWSIGVCFIIYLLFFFL